MKDGDPDAQAAAAVQARISAAQSSLDTAQLAIDRAVHARTVRRHGDQPGAVTPGQAVNPGQTVLSLANLDTLQVETTDLSERDINRVHVGQPVNVTVEGLNQTFTGQVIKIAPRSTKVGGDVVYKVTIPPGYEARRPALGDERHRADWAMSRVKLTHPPLCAPSASVPLPSRRQAAPTSGALLSAGKGESKNRK